MKLRVVRSYQPIEFGTKLETYFVERPSMKNLEMELLKNNIVSIKTDSAYVLVPLTNVAFMIPVEDNVNTADYSKERKRAE